MVSWLNTSMQSLDQMNASRELVFMQGWQERETRRTGPRQQEQVIVFIC